MQSAMRQLHLLAILSCMLVSMVVPVSCLQVRVASNEDVSAARKILFQQAMNPLSLSKENLLVAYDHDDDNEAGDGAEVSGDGLLLGFGQIRPLADDFSELASLYVIPERRKNGIGGALVEALLERHKKKSAPEQVCLLTLKPTAPFYERFGFHTASESERKQLPKAIQLEFQAGNALSLLLGNNLVCMVQE